jgi:hypothetical protein
VIIFMILPGFGLCRQIKTRLISGLNRDETADSLTCADIDREPNFVLRLNCPNKPSEETPMNKFQAMAQIMAILREDRGFQKGSRRYTLARQFIATKIDTMGPGAAYSQAKWAKYQLLVEIEDFLKTASAGKMLSNFI